jgi:hypothetical protein
MPLSPLSFDGREAENVRSNSALDHHETHFFNGCEAENVRSNFALNHHETHCIAGALNSKVAATPMFIDFVP